MLRGLWKLTWIEMKIFMREPLGALGTIGVPVLIFVVLGRFANLRSRTPSPAVMGLSGAGLPVLVALLISVSAVLSLVTIISIYREGGILKRASCYAAAPANHPECPRDRQAPAHCCNIRLDVPGR
jgi:ABC-2 type transport system permease protein